MNTLQLIFSFSGTFRPVRSMFFSLLFVAVMLLLSTNLFAQGSFGKPEKINSGWQFFLGDATGAQAVNFDASRWRTIDVPHDWSVEGTLSPSLASCTGYLPGGIGWYRKTVDILYCAMAETGGSEGY